MSIVDIILANSVTLCLIAELAILILSNKSLDKRDNTYFICFLIIIFILDVTDMQEVYFRNFTTAPPMRYFTSALGYTIRPAALVIIIQIIMRRRPLRMSIWIPTIIVGILTFTSKYTHLVFYYIEGNHFMRGPLAYPSQIVCALYAVMVAALVFKSFHTIDIREIVVIIYSITSCIVGAVIETVTETKFVLPGLITVACALYYIIMYNDVVSAQNQEKRKVLENDLQNGRILLAMSQIRSHFIFNLLNTVSGMCEYDPKKADETLIRISRYLRNNIDIIFTIIYEKIKQYV